MQGARQVRVVQNAVPSGIAMARLNAPATLRPRRPDGVVIYHPSALTLHADSVDGGARMLGVVLTAAASGLLAAALTLALGQSWLMALGAYLAGAMAAPALCILCMLVRTRRGSTTGRYYLDAQGRFHPVPADWMDYCIARPQTPDRLSGLRLPDEATAP